MRNFIIGLVIGLTLACSVVAQPPPIPPPVTPPQLQGLNGYNAFSINLTIKTWPEQTVPPDPLKPPRIKVVKDAILCTEWLDATNTRLHLLGGSIVTIPMPFDQVNNRLGI